MGHRANFVLIENGTAKAFHDQWAALGCTLSLEEGAANLKRSVPKLFAPTNELMDWAFAEGGFLIDYDERRCIVFGQPDVDLAEMPEDYAEQIGPLLDALDKGFPELVAHVANGWRGYTMVWDDRGVDAFAEHLARRGITSIRTQPPSVPASVNLRRPFEVIVDVSDPKRSKKSSPTPKPVVKKAGTKKAVSKKAVTKKAVTKKAVTKKAVAKKAVAKKAVAKKAVTKKAVTKKAVTKKAVAKKAVAKKAVVKKAVVKKAVVKKAVVKKAVAKKAVPGATLPSPKPKKRRSR